MPDGQSPAADSSVESLLTSRTGLSKIRPRRQRRPETAEILQGLVRRIESNNQHEMGYDFLIAQVYAVTGSEWLMGASCGITHRITVRAEVFIRHLPTALCLYQS